MLQLWFLNSLAWKALPARAKVAYIEAFELRYNGDTHLSEREVAETIGCARETASKAIATLIEHGFVRPRIKGQFHVKTRYATRWILPRQKLGQTGVEIRPDGLGSFLSGLETSPDSAAFRAAHGTRF